MNSFFSEFKNTQTQRFTLSHKQNIALWGSCFAENMQTNFREMGFSVRSNPFGVIFNPKSIATLFHKIALNQSLQNQEIIETEMGFTSLLTPSKFSFATREDLENAFQTGSKEAKEAQVYIISLGTAWIYKHNESQLYCANCHKIPQKEFTKRLMSISEIRQSLQEIENIVLKWNKNNKVIYTLSPVRHLKDGFIENQQSKSRLHCALMNRLLNVAVSYFPAYEIMMDELRDYRFYNEDLIHPNPQAINHIWEHFKQYYFTETELKIGVDCKKYYQLSKHKILSNNPIAIDIQQKKMLDLKTILITKHPFLELS